MFDRGGSNIFSYLIDPVMEPRFLIFLKAYHAIYPITRDEVLFMREAYRFFILNYVVSMVTFFFTNSMRLSCREKRLTYTSNRRETL